MRKSLILVLLFVSAAVAYAQKDMRQVQDYEELTDTKPHDGPDVWGRMDAPAKLGWGSVGVRYPKQDVPDVRPGGVVRLTAWKGERVHAQAVLWTNRDLEGVNVSVSALKHGRNAIPASDVSTHFVRYVMTDELNRDGSGGCGHRENKAEWDSLMVADVLDIIDVRNVKACTVQPIWLKVWVPQDMPVGKYKGELTVSGENFSPMSLKVEIDVIDRVLPAPGEWALHLDMWQNPYAVARYYQVPLWSREHFDRMLPVMKMLADVGQRAITASIIHKPWNGQTEDHYDSMITRIKKIDGTWSYDYTVFDRWVEFMMDEVGIGEMINCYTMIPWDLRFDYYDQATNRVQFVMAKPGDEAYAEYWHAFLKDFSRHLREKGWFGKTLIAMDERPMEAMRVAIDVIRKADPEFKISLAGNYHPEIVSDLYYLSIPYGHTFPDDVIAGRRSKGQISCVYTCCTECFPNIFTFSDPSEATWTAMHALAAGYDGYLRWAVNSWTADPLRDSRFRLFAAGDTYSIYPGPRSSIRFERFMEGLQYCEKVRVLRNELEMKGAEAKLKKLEDAVSLFTPKGMDESGLSADECVTKLARLLNTL